MLLEPSYLGFQKVMDSESTRTNGVKNSPNIVTPRTCNHTQELELDHEGENVN